MSKLVSILVPVYNRERVIVETIQSALNQTYKNTEVIVVDNASSDGTWTLIKSLAASDKRIKAFRNNSNIGPVRNWIRCAEKASGYYGKILWSDDLISPDFLEKCIALFNDETAFVYSGVKIFDGKPEDGRKCFFISKTGHLDIEQYINRALMDNNVPVSPGCAVFRLKDIRENLLVDIENKINSDFSMHAIGNDLMLFLLTSKEYKKFGFVSEALSFFRAHQGSISSSPEKGKLPLHYTLVRANFAENYKKDMLDKVIANAWLLLKRYPEHDSFGINGINDFVYSDVKLRYLDLMFVITMRLLRLPVRISEIVCRKRWR
jgi:glycosyltransferase involved in cell wall biosynthesis